MQGIKQSYNRAYRRSVAKEVLKTYGINNRNNTNSNLTQTLGSYISYRNGYNMKEQNKNKNIMFVKKYLNSVGLNNTTINPNFNTEIKNNFKKIILNGINKAINFEKEKAKLRRKQPNSYFNTRRHQINQEAARLSNETKNRNKRIVSRMAKLMNLYNVSPNNITQQRHRVNKLREFIISRSLSNRNNNNAVKKLVTEVNKAIPPRFYTKKRTRFIKFLNI